MRTILTVLLLTGTLFGQVGRRSGGIGPINNGTNTTTIGGKPLCTVSVTTNCVVNANGSGSVPVGTAIPGGAPAGSVGVLGDVYASIYHGDGSQLSGITGAVGPLIIAYTAGSGGVAINSLVKLDTDGTVIAVTGTEGILGIAKSTATAGNPVNITVVGAASCVAEGAITAGHYVIAGTTTPTKCKDSEATTMQGVPISTRTVGKASASVADGVTFSLNVFGTYRSGTQITLPDLPSGLNYTPGAGTLTGPATSGTISPTPGANGIPQLDGSSNLALPGSLAIGTTLPTNAPSGTTGSKVFYSPSGPMLNVKAFGAACDWNGSTGTDDTTAIQDAMTAAQSGPISTIFLPGWCKTTATLTFIAPANVVKPVVLVGPGYGFGGLMWGGALNGTILQIGRAASPVPTDVLSVGFDSVDSAHRAGTAIQSLGTVMGHINLNWFGNIRDGFVGSWFQTSGIEKNYFVGITRDAISLNAATATNNGDWIEHNEFIVCGRYCINWQDAGGSGNVIGGNDFEGTISGTLASVNLLNVTRSTLRENRFEDSTPVGGAGFRSVILNLCHFTTVTSNSFGEGGSNNAYLVEIDGATQGVYSSFNKIANPGITANFQIANTSSSDIYSFGDAQNTPNIWGGVGAALGQTIGYGSGNIALTMKGSGYLRANASGVKALIVQGNPSDDARLIEGRFNNGGVSFSVDQNGKVESATARFGAIGSNAGAVTLSASGTSGGALFLVNDENGSQTIKLLGHEGTVQAKGLLLTALPTSCSGQPTNTVASIAGVLTLCP